MGDFNVDLLKYDSYNSHRDFLNNLTSSGFLPHILQPTRITDFSATLIDNIYGNNFEHETISGNILIKFADHFSQFLSVKKEIIRLQPNDSMHVSHNSFSTHFKNLLNCSNQNEIPRKCKEAGQLDYSITPDELKKASEILKSGKSVGIDNLSNEMLSCLVDSTPLVLIKLFNLILDGGEVLPDWTTAYIVPMHKNGMKSDPLNYRGISLLSCLGKLFLSILNNRLLNFSIKHKILSDN